MIAALFSGGKDSTLAVHKAHQEGKTVELLVTMSPEDAYSYMFHKPGIQFTPLQAEAMGIKQVMAITKGEKEEELADLERVLRGNNVTELFTGAVASSYQKSRIDAICSRLGIVVHSPLWHIDPMEELNELASKFNVIVTQVAAEGFDESFLGARIDGRMIEKLMRLKDKYQINPLFEGGEAESFVLDAPLFRKRIKIISARSVWEGQVGRYVIEKAELVEKDV
ncbi:MAG: TIGR00289 family protein [Candidatus Marsarchaeota archaeon]|jgi:ABC transporter with metal-binding/Fe-S-binding domain ATP-binding protein|nr:TIGR00289 family protein [Candidatus Marsarchaeota archaeon]MCL5112506.1 TIGR00289 family protein [Candidatus Marsarchaeota archaeon]